MGSLSYRLIHSGILSSRVINRLSFTRPFITHQKYIEKEIPCISCAQLRCSSTAAETARAHCNVGTVGHIDHGKTTLTAAITKVLEKQKLSKYVPFKTIDHHPDEVARGITINTAHVSYASKKRHYAHTDCPGHREYIRNMISGASQMEGAILVVAATEGLMPQTKEHILLAKRLGIKYIIVFINKADLVDDDTLEIAELEIRQLLLDFEYDDNKCPFIIGSALLALNGDPGYLGEQCIHRLIDALDETIPDVVRDYESPFLLPIDNFLAVPGRGTVVVGTLTRGIIKKSSTSNVDILGFDQRIKTSVRDIQIFQKSMKAGVAGENMGILLRAITIKDLRRGMSLCPKGAYQLMNRFEAALYVLDKTEKGRSEPFGNITHQILHSSTWKMSCRVDQVPNQIIMPDEYGEVSVTLFQRMHFELGQSFTLRNNFGVTVATGKITKILPTIYITDPRMKILNFKHIIPDDKV